MKRRETKGVYEDRLSGMLPDPSRLSAVSRSPLVRAGARWLSFARGLARGARRRTAAADALRFIESLYGGKFASTEGGAFPLDKVYRTAGGGLFVSETRLSMSVHPRFDLRLLGVSVGPAVWQRFREAPAATMLARAGATGRARQRDASRITNPPAAAPSLTVQTWNVWPAAAERVLPPFGRVTLRGRRVRQAQGPESAPPAARVDVATAEYVVTSRPTDAAAPEGLRPASLDLPRQEFVSLILNTYLPAVVSRELLSVRTTLESSGASPGQATAQGAAARRPATWTYAEPAPRRAPGGAVEIRREFHSAETLKGHAPGRGPLHPLLGVLPPASLLSSLTETSLTMLAQAAGHITYQLAGRAPALRLLGAHASPPGRREGARAIEATRLGRTSQTQPRGARGVLSRLRTFVEHIRPAVAGVAPAGNPTFYTRPGFEQVSSRQRGAPGVAGPRGFAGTAPAAAVLTLEKMAREVSARTAPDVFSTRGAPSAATFLFATGPRRRSPGTSTAGAPSPAAAGAGAERARGEARAARPEGMALELIRHRREQVLQLPQPGYVFTQPRRAQLEERQVITKASREEIVEVVRKEVRSLAAAAPAGHAPWRAELAGLADEVYSTLVRRLLVEKERLGRF